MTAGVPYQASDATNMTSCIHDMLQPRMLPRQQTYAVQGL